MAPLVLREPAAAIAFWGVSGTWMAGEVAFAIRTTLRDPGTRDPSVLVLTAASTSGFLAAILVADHVRSLAMPGSGWPPLVAGLGVLVAGLVVRVWAIRELGRFFKFTIVVQPGHRVVDTGPYRLIRHPSYTGLVVGMLGLGIMLGNWLSAPVAMLPTLAGFTVRLLHEERVLATELGEPYRAYELRTKRLIPWVW